MRTVWQLIFEPLVLGVKLGKDNLDKVLWPSKVATIL